jgi:hypothetical protein
VAHLAVTLAKENRIMNAKVRSAFAVVAACAMLGGGVACGDDDSGTDNSGKSVSEIEMTSETSMEEGSQQQFTAVVRYSDGSSRDITADPDTVWSSSDVDVATVSETGLVQAIDEGGVEIKVSWQGNEATEDFVVTP